MDIPEEDNAQVAKRKAIQTIMRDAALNPQEKQKKIQQYMATGGPAASAAPANPPPPSQSAPPPQSQPPPSVAPATSKHAMMQEVVRDTSLTPDQKQQRIQQIVAGDTPAPAQEVAPPADAAAPLSASRQAMMDVMRDPNLTPQEKQQRVQQISGGGARPGPDPDPPTVHSTPERPSDSKQAITSIMKDDSLTSQEKQQRVQQIMASGVPPPAATPTPSSQSSAPSSNSSAVVSSVERDAISKSRARNMSRATQPGATPSEPPRGPPSNAAVTSLAEQDAMAKNHGSGSPQPTAMVNMERDIIAKVGTANAASSTPGAVSAVDGNQYGKGPGRSAQSQVGAVSSTNADPASRKAARASARAGAASAVSTESDPATRNAALPSTHSVADTSVASSQGQGGYGAPGAAASSGVDPASRKNARSLATTPGASSNSGVDPASRKTERASARPTAAVAVASSSPPVEDKDQMDIRQFEDSLVEKTRSIPPPDSNPSPQDYPGDGYVQQSSQPEGPEIASVSIIPQSTYEEPAQSYDGGREIVDHSPGPVAASPEAPTVETPAYAGLNYDPANIVGAEEGGLQAFVADTAVEALGVAAVMSETEEEEMHRQKYKRRMRWVVIGLFIVLIAIIVPTVIKVTSNEDDVIVELVPTASPSAAPSSAPSSAPTSADFNEFLDIINTLYDDDDAFEEAFGDLDSPQYKAALWATSEGSLGLAPGHPRTLNRYSLATFYFATKGDNWFRCGRESTDCADDEEWLTPSDECRWLAVGCVDVAANDRRISQIFFRPSLNLQGNNVAGTLPGDVGFLTDMTTLILSAQNVTGSIPDSFSSLSNLESVLLLKNRFTGTFPQVLIGPSLRAVQLGENYFTGQLPSSISSTALTDLRFDLCQFTGTIPPEIANLPNLVLLEMQGNELTGTIPDELYSLTNLRVLRLSETVLNGTLSEEIGRLTALQQLGLQDTHIGGSLPEALFTLIELMGLNLANSAFSGPLSESFGLLSNATQILLDNNFFTGTISMGFEQLSYLKDLTLHENYLTGSISDALCERKGVAFFDLRFLTADCLGEPPRVICTTPECCDECFAGREYDEITSLSPTATPTP